MSLDLHIIGPGLDVSRRLLPGEPSLVIGRDADCTIPLPDPLRQVSRRHLSVWNEGGLMQFHVLSVVNGVETDEGELPPGARGALAPGESLLLSEYKLEVAAVPSATPVQATGEAPDPWAEFEKEAAHLLSTVAAQPAAEEDPFGDWGFQSTFGPGAGFGQVAGGAAQASSGELGAFFQGLGMSGVVSGAFTGSELEIMGRVTRMALQGLLQGLQAAGGSRQALRVEDRTVLDPAQVNPLRMDTPLESKLWYLFGGSGAAAGCIPPDRAVREVVTELVAHQQAMGEAAHQAVQAVLAEFDPETLKQRLLPGGAKLFESSRAWDAYVRDYAEHKQDLESWVRQLMDRHFAEAYTQARLRVKRHTEPGPSG